MELPTSSELLHNDFMDNLTPDQKRAMDKAPRCVDLEQVEDWGHVVFRVEHPVCLRSEGEDFYTRREALACQRWLKKFAPDSEYASASL